MSLLLKTSLKNIYKNKFSIFILFFFTTGASTVFLTSEHLKKNIDNSISPFKYPKNTLHDFVVYSQPNNLSAVPGASSFDDSIYTKPAFIDDFGQINFASSYAWKYNLSSNKLMAWNKTISKDKDGNFTSTFQPTKAPVDFALLDVTDKGANYHSNVHVLACGKTMVDSVRKKTFSFDNTNELIFLKLQDNVKDISYSQNILKGKWISESCAGVPSWSTFVEYDAFFDETFLLFKNQNEDKDILKNYENEWKKDNTKQWELTQDENDEINRNNYNKIYQIRNVNVINGKLEVNFFPFISKDFFVAFPLKFANWLSSGVDLNQKWQDLIVKIKNSPLFYNLPSDIKKLINEHYKNFYLFNDLKLKYFLSNFYRTFHSDSALKNLYLPHIPSIPYKQQIFLLHKLIMWNFLKENHNPTKDNSFQNFPKKSLDIGKYFRELKKNNYKKITDLLQELKKADVSNLHKSDEKLTDLMKGNEKSKSLDEQLKLPSLEELLFSNVSEIDKQFDTTKNTFKNKKRHDKYKETITDSSQSSKDLSEIQTNSKKIKDVLINYWEEWMKTSVNKKIPSSNFWTIDTTADNEEVKDIAYKNSSTKFDTVLNLIIEHTKRQIENYIRDSSLNHVKSIKDFFNSNNIFNISFLVCNYLFDDNKLIRIDDKKSYRRIKKLNNLEIKNHRSSVVQNTNNISAKLNDPTKINHKFKLINNSNNSNNLNKLKIFEGNPLFVEKDNYLEIIKDFIKTRHSNKPASFYRPILKILLRAKYTSADMNKMLKEWYDYLNSPYEKTWEHGHFFNANDYKNLVSAVESLAAGGYTELGSKINLDLKIHVNFKTLRTYDINIPMTDFSTMGYIQQPTSFFVLVSPEYAKNNNIQPISQEDYDDFKTTIENPLLSQENWEKKYWSFILDKTKNNHVININGKKVIVTGIAQSEDFLFPALSWLNIIPNKENEALVYMDEHAYKNFVFSGRILYFENYLSFKYPEVVRKEKIEEKYIEKLHTFLNEYIPSYPYKLVKTDASVIDDTSLFSVRNNYITEFKKILNLMSWLIVTIICAIISIVVFILVKKYIQKNMNVFGGFIANGTTKFLIMINATVFVLVPIFIASVSGYLISLFSQKTLFGIVTDFWYLPTGFMSFSVFELLKFLLMTMGIGTVMSLIAAAWILKDSVSNLLKQNAIFNENNFTNQIYKFFSNVSTIWKFRLGIIFNTINQTLILVSSSIIIYTLLNFSLHNMGKIQKVSAIESRSKNHGFEIDYVSPSEESGQYHLKTYFDLGRTFTNNIENKQKIIYQKNKIANIKFNKENPELIAASANSHYHPEDFKPFSDCLEELITQNSSNVDKAFQTFHEKYLNINPTAIHSAAKYHEVAHYLSQSTISNKKNSNNQNSNSSTPKCDAIKEHESKFSPTKTINNEIVSIFHTSKYTYDNYNNTISQSTSDSTQSSTSTSSGAGQSQGKEKLWKIDLQTGEPFNFAEYIPREKEKKDDNTLNIYDDKPLFAHLHDLYTSPDYKAPFSKYTNTVTEGSDTAKAWYFNSLDQESAKSSSTQSSSGKKNSSPSLEKKEDFFIYEHENASKEKKKYFLPTLNRLWKDNSNYLLIGINDLQSVKNDPSFFKNKIFVRLLVDHDFELNFVSQTVRFNIWDKFKDVIERRYPELMMSIEKNHYEFIKNIIASKYGEFFVQRFMTPHNISTTNSSAMKSHRAGEIFDKKASFYVGPNTVNDKFKDKLMEGIYYIDPMKVFYVYDALRNTKTGEAVTEEDKKHPNNFIVYRPDFLYMFYAIMNDEEFLHPRNSPSKFIFNYSLYTPSYTDQKKKFSITGDVSEDQKQDVGLTSTHTKPQYNSVPNGDQTFTKIYGQIVDKYGNKNPWKILGVKQDSRGSYIQLYKDDDLINKRLYASPKNGAYPIVINKYFAKYFDLEVGATIQYQVFNHYGRFEDAINEKSKPKIHNLYIVDTYDGYLEDTIFMSQENANKILGLNPEYGYNGLLINKTENPSEIPSQFHKVISIYSESGVFANIMTEKNDNSLKIFLKEEPVISSIAGAYDWFNEKSPFFVGTNKETFLARYNLHKDADVENLFFKAFGAWGTTQHSLISGVANNQLTSDIWFNKINNLIHSVIACFFGTLAPTLLFALITITKLILDDLKNLLVVLKLLGFSTGENFLPIVLYLSIVCLLSSIIGTGIFSIGINIYVNSVFSGLKILLPISIEIKHLLLSFSILGLIFSGLIAKSNKNVKKLYLPIAMKTLTD